MKLRLTRKYLKDTYTIGKLEVWKNGVWAYLCDTLEDKVRPDGIKVYGKTAIPYGTYTITMNVVSSKYSNYKTYPFARPYGAYMPRLVNVKNFDGILIHPGNSPKDTYGCILVGRNKAVGKVLDSQAIWRALMEGYFMPAKKTGEAITIEIVKNG